MSPERTTSALASGGENFKFIFNLLPLLSDGPASLAPEPGLNIDKVLLVTTVHAWHNAFNESTMRRADDLFACAAQDGAYYDTIPKGAELAEATFDFRFAGCDEPHLVEIKVPSTLILRHPEDAERVLEFLCRRKFATRQS